MVDAGKVALYLRWMLEEIGIIMDAPTDHQFLADNQGAVRLAKKNKGRLSYKIQRELEALPELISALEQRQLVLTELMSAPDFYQEHREQYLQITNELEKVSSELEVALERWLELEA